MVKKDGPYKHPISKKKLEENDRKRDAMEKEIKKRPLEDAKYENHYDLLKAKDEHYKKTVTDPKYRKEHEDNFYKHK